MVSSSKRMQKPLFEDLDSSLLMWFSQLRSAQPMFFIDGGVCSMPKPTSLLLGLVTIKKLAHHGSTDGRLVTKYLLRD